MKKTKKAPLRFYMWRQNNSGGRFRDPACFVAIQAASQKDATQKAEALGLYFDGAGDCPCCGDRWSATPDEVADTPSMYNVPLREAAANSMDSSWLIAYADGREERSEVGPRDGGS